MSAKRKPSGRMRRLVDGVAVCYRGHPIVGWNAQPNTGGYTRCRICANAAARECMANKRRRKLRGGERT